MKTHVAAPASTNSQGLTAKPVREELSVFCACTELVETGLGAEYVECGGQYEFRRNPIIFDLTFFYGLACFLVLVPCPLAFHLLHTLMNCDGSVYSVSRSV